MLDFLYEKDFSPGQRHKIIKLLTVVMYVRKISATNFQLLQYL